MIGVVLADDQPLVRMGLRVLIDSTDDLEVLGEAEDGESALAVIRRTRPDVVLLDIRMPGMDGLQALRVIIADPALSGASVVLLTTFELDEYVDEALRSGASGFLLKDAEPAEILRAIRVVAAGDALLSPSVTRRLITSYARTPAPPQGPSSSVAMLVAALTEREREVVNLVARGLSNDDIARRLSISGATARTHVSRAMLKVHARDRAQLVVLAYESGLLLS